MTEYRNQARGAGEWAATYGDMGTMPQIQLRELPLQLLDPWQGTDGKPQPFTPYTREELEELAENIRLNGVIEAICVRPKENGRFQIIAGHHRTEAAGLAGLKTIPGKIEYLDDNQAAIRMVDSNLKRRKKIRHSEKAFAYKLRLESMKRQGQRTDLTSRPLVGKSETADMVAENESGRQVQRYIRLTELIRPLLDLVDEEKMAFRAGVELSYLEKADQQLLLELLQERRLKAPSMAQAARLREKAAGGRLTTDDILSILVKPPKSRPATIQLSAGRISRYFPPNTSAAQMELEICAALELYRKNHTPTSA